MSDQVSLPETLTEIDRLALELSKANRKIAVANAEKAISQNELAEVSYKYLVLQIYMKYNLTEKDVIDENGVILRGGAVKNEK